MGDQIGDQIGDDELDGILDDALDAFDKEPSVDAKASSAVQEAKTPDQDGVGVTDETAKALEEALGTLAQMGFENGATDMPEDVNENDLKVLEDIFRGMGAAGDAAGPAGNGSGSKGANVPGPAIEQMVESIVGHLLSEDVLKKPMMTMREVYAKWLPENAESLSAEELGRYSKQQELIEEICERFDKKAKTSEIMELLGEMQKTGQPPEAVMKAVDSEQGGGLPAMPLGDMAGLGDQCGMQ